MEIYEAIKQRRSIHDFNPQNVEESKLTSIFAGASWAPTHRMKEPWEVHIIQNKAVASYAERVTESYLRLGYAEVYDNEKQRKLMEGIQQHLLSIPHHAIIYMEKEKDLRLFEEDYAAVCAFIQNVQLLAWSHGVGVLWTTNPYIYDREFSRSCGIDPDLYKIVSVLQMGYPNRIPQPKRRTPIEQKVNFIND
ncbi:nitroreductase family protein [Thalassobacillus devorans]|uniref:nitroreductase family protein n=1 Tax=Thalassobacillus devorans TaxID=279813 RepID=UPI000A1CCA81|nr:nitroreductase [Thalassobacillus devorans]